jgi:hypothetical protein
LKTVEGYFTQLRLKILNSTVLGLEFTSLGLGFRVRVRVRLVLGLGLGLGF